ncbi:hypothetical protein GZH47_22920 [Paenibacillus rhizovicinus]|uniref:Uncharacterized protein n=1 Tax=Paenibacillus rhizovicinus TaxID=2704463 RepID=A0A6C0PA10_9BACL|nr:hypothetical protein [Paenibacillus rhizovicinus]QHW33362.1 hypothetical protein GZH47_22920 [Paenibacillus rhizovicinus]
METLKAMGSVNENEDQEQKQDLNQVHADEAFNELLFTIAEKIAEALELLKEEGVPLNNCDPSRRP